MPEFLSVRLLLEAPPTAPQLKGLRTAFPALAEISVAHLRDHLAAWPICVVGSVRQTETAALTESMNSLGVGVEFFTFEDYGAPYVTSLMPSAPATWNDAEHALELQFRPSFSPEVLLRLWSDGDTAWLQLASLNTSVWVRRFNTPPWLMSRSRRVVMVRGRGETGAAPPEPEIPSERPHSEIAEVDPVDALLRSALDLEQPEAGHGLDGMFVEIVARSGARLSSRELWSPTPSREPEAHSLLSRAHSIAWSRLCDPESRRRLEELHSAIGLGLAMEDLGGSPRVVRLWGGLSVHDEAPLRRLLGDLSATGGVLDLTDVSFVATMLVDAVGGATESVHFVAADRHQDLLLRAGIAPGIVHASRTEALAASAR